MRNCRCARRPVNVGLDLRGIFQGASERDRGGLQQRRDECSDGGYAEKRQLKRGIKKLVGVPEQVEDRDQRKKIQHAAASEEESRDGVESESGGGADGWGVRSGNQRVKPGAAARDNQRGNFVEHADTQQKKQAPGEDGDVESGNHQRVIPPPCGENYRSTLFRASMFRRSGSLPSCRWNMRRRGRVFCDAVDGRGARDHK